MPATEALTEEWVQELVAASAELPSTGAPNASVALTIGKKRSVVLMIEDGRIVGGNVEGADGDAAVSVPTSEDQLSQFFSGTDSIAQAYMRGDIKPVGPIGEFLPLVEVFEALAH